jgi:hypothetical protein
MHKCVTKITDCVQHHVCRSHTHTHNRLLPLYCSVSLSLALTTVTYTCAHTNISEEAEEPVVAAALDASAQAAADVAAEA